MDEGEGGIEGEPAAELIPQGPTPEDARKDGHIHGRSPP